MPDDIGIIGKGTILKADGATVANLIDVRPPQQKYQDVDMTQYDSDIETYVPGWKNAGEMTIKIGYGATGAAAVNGLFDGAVHTFVIQYPNTGQESFAGYANEVGGEVPLKERITRTLKIKLTTVVTYSTGS